MAEVISMWPSPEPTSAIGLILARMPHLARSGPAEWGGVCPCDHHDTTDAVWGVLTLEGSGPEWFCARECSTGALWAYLWPEQAARAQATEAEEATTNPLDDLAIPLSITSLRAVPPPREYLLTDATTGAGVFVSGKVGLLAASGGSGKSWALTQLAVSLATGATWFGQGGWVPTNPGRVLLMLGEEDPEEVRRRIHYSARNAGCVSDEHLELVARNITAFGLTGTGVGLVTRELVQSQFAADIVALLQRAVAEGRPYLCAILDPLSRFAAGCSAETENDAATIWVQQVERFTLPDCGKPSVFVATHTRKPSKEDAANPGNDSQADVRGSSALVDAARWVARLVQQKREEGQPDLLTLRVVKANGAPPQMGPLVLCRDAEHEGTLRLATPGEQEAHEGVKKLVAKRLQAIEGYEGRVLEFCRPGVWYSRNEIAGHTGNKAGTLAAIAELIRQGRMTIDAPGRMGRVALSGTGTDAGTTDADASSFGGSSGSTHPLRGGTGNHRKQWGADLASGSDAEEPGTGTSEEG